MWLTCLSSVPCSAKNIQNTCGIGSMCFKGGEQKLPGLHVSTSSSPTSSPQSLKEDLHSSYSLLLGHGHHPINPLCSPQHPRWKGGHSPLFLSNQNPNGLLPQRGNIHQQKHRETCQWTKISHTLIGGIIKTPRKGRQLTGSPP